MKPDLIHDLKAILFQMEVDLTELVRTNLARHSRFNYHEYTIEIHFDGRDEDNRRADYIVDVYEARNDGLLNRDNVCIKDCWPTEYMIKVFARRIKASIIALIN